MQGPIKVTVQELDGSFNHMLQIEENSLKHDIPCHSKSRRCVRDQRPFDTVLMSEYISVLIWFTFHQWRFLSPEIRKRRSPWWTERRLTWIYQPWSETSRISSCGVWSGQVWPPLPSPHRLLSPLQCWLSSAVDPDRPRHVHPEEGGVWAGGLHVAVSAALWEGRGCTGGPMPRLVSRPGPLLFGPQNLVAFLHLLLNTVV